MKNDSLITPKQLAGLLHVDVGTIYTWLSRKTLGIPYIKASHKCVRFKQSDVLKWIKQKTLKTPIL